MPAEPISVLYDAGRDEWLVKEPTHTEDVLATAPTKQEAIEDAKTWATGDASWTDARSQHISHVVIHTVDGAPQRGWWPPNNRFIRVQPAGSDVKREYPGIMDDFRADGHQEPYWVVEKQTGDRWNLLDVAPTKQQAVEEGRDRWERDWVKRLSIYGADWYKEDERTHEI